MGWSINPEYKPIEDPIKSRPNLTATRAAIKEMLKDGTPDWYTHPEDYKQMALESYAYDKELSDNQVSEYRMEDMDILLDFEARNTNIISTKDFVLKLRAYGVPCLALYNGMPQTVGLWAIVPTKHGGDIMPVCFMQTPAMIEWSILSIDEHGLPAGEEYRGWRTVLCELIKKGVITEQKAHEIFGRPTESVVSRRYRRSLSEFRHRRKNIELSTGF